MLGRKKTKLHAFQRTLLTVNSNNKPFFGGLIFGGTYFRGTVCSTNMNSRWLTANFQENFPQTMAPFASFIPPRWANRPFVRYKVRLSVNLGQTLVDLFVWTDKSSSKHHLHRRTDGQPETLFVSFHIRRFVRPDDLFLF